MDNNYACKIDKLLNSIDKGNYVLREIVALVLKEKDKVESINKSLQVEVDALKVKIKELKEENEKLNKQKQVANTANTDIESAKEQSIHELLRKLAVYGRKSGMHVFVEQPLVNQISRDVSVPVPTFEIKIDQNFADLFVKNALEITGSVEATSQWLSSPIIERTTRFTRVLSSVFKQMGYEPEIWCSVRDSRKYLEFAELVKEEVINYLGMEGTK